jgi:hypothetical protein
MIEITINDLLQKPKTKRMTPLGKLIAVFDVIVSNPIKSNR